MFANNTKLERSSKSPFTKAVKQIHGLIKKGQVKVQTPKIKKKPTIVAETPVEPVEWAPRLDVSHGVVYLSRLPHGFEEDGIKEYLQQFGNVVSVKVVRSKRTGRSRGFAFVEFQRREVAEIVAKTMNNYLMYNKLVKAKMLEPEATVRWKNTPRTTDPDKCAPAKSRRGYLRCRDKVQTSTEEEKKLLHTYKHARRVSRKLRALGISFKLERSSEHMALMPLPDVDSDEKEDIPVLVQDSSDSEIDFVVPPGVPVQLKSHT